MECCKERLMLAVLIELYCMWRTDGQIEVTMKVPRTVDDCYSQALLHPIDPNSAKMDCIQRLMFYEPDQNLTQQALRYFGSLRGSAHGDPAPKTGFRFRKEYRRLSDTKRGRLREAFNKLYQKGILRRYADLHRNAIEAAREGAAFLAWNRIFLAMFEDELRHMDPTVSLPYWDSSLDHNMDNGFNSDIVFPVNPPSDFSTLDYILEFHSNGVHKWVGGDMADGHFAAYDPLFYMHQAYTDYLWEYFRHRQKTVCGINPETSYAKPPYRPTQGPEDLMYGFSEFKNIDGYREYWTRTWYDYEVVPECPNCESKYLYCGQAIGHCVSHFRRTDFNAGKYKESPMANGFGIPSEPFEPLSIVLPKRNLYTFLSSPTNDHRTRVTALRDSKRVLLAIPVVPVSKPRTPPPPQVKDLVALPIPLPPTSMSRWIQNLEPPPARQSWDPPPRGRPPPPSPSPVARGVPPRPPQLPPAPHPAVGPPLGRTIPSKPLRGLRLQHHQNPSPHVPVHRPRDIFHKRRPQTIGRPASGQLFDPVPRFRQLSPRDRRTNTLHFA